MMTAGLGLTVGAQRGHGGILAGAGWQRRQQGPAGAGAFGFAAPPVVPAPPMLIASSSSAAGTGALRRLDALMR